MNTNNAGRDLLLNYFNENVIGYLRNVNVKILKIAIVGGSKFEPELELIGVNFKYEVIVFGIDNFESTVNLDLNKSFHDEKWFEQFDLVICNQVLEHVYNIQNAFLAMSKLLKQNGFLWINCPAANRVHGSPDFYSAGYSMNYLIENVRLVFCDVLLAGSIGTERLYKITLSRQDFSWPSTVELQNPFLLSMQYLKSRNLKRIIGGVFKIPTLLQIYLWKNRVEFNTKFATESFVFCKKSTTSFR